MRLMFRGSGRFFSPAMQDYASRRFLSLEKLLRTIPPEEIVAEVLLKRITHHHHKGKVWQVKVSLSFPGQLLRAEQIDEDPKAAVDAVKDELKESLTHLKEKLRAKFLRGHRRAKKDLHLSRSARLWRKGRIRQEAR